MSHEGYDDETVGHGIHRCFVGNTFGAKSPRTSEDL